MWHNIVLTKKDFQIVMTNSTLIYILRHCESGTLDSIQSYDLEWKDVMSTEIKLQFLNEEDKKCCFSIHFLDGHIYGFRKKSKDGRWMSYTDILTSYKDLIEIDPMTGKVEKLRTLNDLQCLGIDDYLFNENVSLF